MGPAISIIIICKNEARVIKRCIEAILIDMGKDDELLVVDSGSTDGTLEILSDFEKVKVFHFKWVDDFSAARNFGIAKASKEWIFFIDSDEELVEGSLDKLRQVVLKTREVSEDNKQIVFSPRVINQDDSVVYNAGRIIPNNGGIIFEGCVHEYPVVVDEGSELIGLKTPEVSVRHDGYTDKVVKDKNKAVRNTTLIKRILEKDPDNSRYYYFYFRDAKPLLPDHEYEQGLLDFFKKFPKDSYSNQVAKDLADFYIEQGRNDEADRFIKMLFESAERGNVDDRPLAILLTVLNELGRIDKQQRDLLELLVYTHQNILNQKESTFGEGYIFEDLIGTLFFSLKEFKVAKQILEKFQEVGFDSNLSRVFEKLYSEKLE